MGFILPMTKSHLTALSLIYKSMTTLQLTSLHNTFDTLQKTYGEKTLCSVYGA
jgi:hypothetical protein